MDKTVLVNTLCALKCENLEEYENEEILTKKIYASYEDLKINENTVIVEFSNIPDVNFNQIPSKEWQFLALNFYILKKLNEKLSSSDTEILSVQQAKTVKICIKDLVSVGILKNLQPNMPFCVKSKQNCDIILTYNILKSSTLILCDFLSMPEIRLLLLPDSLQAILVSIYQISYCPLLKPNTTSKSGFFMSEEMHTNFTRDKIKFRIILTNLSKNIHPGIFVKETMIIFQEHSPVWFKKSVSQTLTNTIKSKNGVENIALALLDGANDDSTKIWKTLEVISKLLISCSGFPEFRENIAKQIISLLDKVEDDVVFERIFTHYTKTLYQFDEFLCKDIFVRRLVNPFLKFCYKEYKIKDNTDITKELLQNIRILFDVFHLNSGGTKNLPIEILQPIFNVIFRLYCITRNIFKTTQNELIKIILEIFKSYKNKFDIFDSFLFGISLPNISQFRSDITVNIEAETIKINTSKHKITYPVSDNAESILEILKNQENLQVELFGYLLNCITQKEKYFPKENLELLGVEKEFMNDYFERSLTVYKLLSDLANDEKTQKKITEKPENVIKYIKNVLVKTLEVKTHQTKDCDSESFQSVFTVIMILQSLTINEDNLGKYKDLEEPLAKIYEETTNKELQDLIQSILDTLNGEKPKSTRLKIDETPSELDKAIEDVCDPLIPVRGHGLMALTKLIENKDKGVLEKKQYVLNIFQQNLKNVDSYIYLSSIGGLAAMADIFPDTILNILCEEFTDFSKKDDEDGQEVRTKLGEVLVRVTKKLGEMAPKYKSLLLNTFLNGTKDEDELIRASSLSNLGEICRVLGYKLGSIITEILVCVHCIITTDKSLEARRAAVTVIRQLFLGLEDEMIAFLKDDILPVYRTLKQIYQHDKDDVMRLQAQLALEELNENMKNFVFPKQQLNMEKKIIMLD
ncbi:unnamed protein product [Brassicogethes aeneus]|uniref:Transport and Golgi organization protein 6 homolog n=1 Tax=Brassicogethes aeneus TaxID=1431903 RepID=A0A9P0FJN0_BRAAE|nr:unnamed protein product [Brassicogethes aeneus]